MVKEVKYIEDTDYKITSFDLNYKGSDDRYYYKAKISLNMYRTVDDKYIKCSQINELTKCSSNNCDGIHGAFDDKKIFMEHFCKLVIFITNQLNEKLKRGTFNGKIITIGELALMIREGKFKHKNKCKLISEVWYQAANFIIHIVMPACDNLVEITSDTDDYIMNFLSNSRIK